MKRNLFPRTLQKNLPYHAGRDARGRISMRHQGGRHKRKYRTIDFARDKHDVPARVESIIYDPNRGADIALLVYQDGDKRYILAPDGLKEGMNITAGIKSELTIGNALPVSKIPIGTAVHNVEMRPGGGGVFARGAGNQAIILGEEKGYVRIKLPSGEIRQVEKNCYATIGQLSNVDIKHQDLGKAGRSRHLGIRPTVRGVAQDPSSHPHGGGEGRSGIGMPGPKTPWGKKASGVKTRNPKKQSNALIIKRRKQ
jgi:large subunit ribosomal protein L2